MPAKAGYSTFRTLRTLIFLLSKNQNATMQLCKTYLKRSHLTMYMLQDLAYLQCSENLRQLPIRIEHDPYCDCDQPKTCTRKAKLIAPTEQAMYPLKALAEVQKEDFKKTLKQALLDQKTVKKEPLEWFFLTVNFHPDITLEKGLAKILKTCKGNLFSDYIAVIEQRGNSAQTCGQGLHAHILFKRILPLTEGLPPSNIKRNLKDSYKKFCSTTQQTLNQQFINEHEALEKYRYVIGKNKTGQGKDVKQDYDLIFRRKHNLQDYYGNIDIFKSNGNVQCPQNTHADTATTDASAMACEAQP